MRNTTRLALASGGALLLSLASVPLVQARQGSDDSVAAASTTTDSNVTPGSDDSTKPSINGDTTDKAMQVEKLRADAELRSADARKLVDKAKADALKRVADAQNKAGMKLEAAKLRVCQNHEKSIDALMGRIGDRGSQHLELVDTISARIQKFVTDKQLTVAGYDTLLASIATAKATAQSANDAVKAAQPTFKCDGTDPTGAADSFKTLAKARDDAIKAYRDSVKALLVAVKTAAQAATATPTTNTGSGQ